MNARTPLVLTVALSSLLLGVLVYLMRPADAWFLTTLNFRADVPPLGLADDLTGSLPSFTHALSFTLLSTLALGVSRRAALFSAALWLAVEIMFEVGQHAAVSAYLNRAGLGLAYFRGGTFDTGDLAACSIGVASALALLRTVHSGKERDA